MKSSVTSRSPSKSNPLTRKPIPRLELGMTLGVLAPSGSTLEVDALERGIGYLEDLGFRVQVGSSARSKRYGYLAAPDQVRAQDLMEAFVNPTIDAILCFKGGYGTPRILDLLDYQVIARHPKPVIGYSDITGLQLALFTQAGLPSWHGSMVMSFTGNLDQPSRDYWLWALTHQGPLGEVSAAHPPQGFDMTGLNVLGQPGAAEGRIIGGNLSLVSTLCGTPYGLDLAGAILFLEDVDEEPYRVDRMLNQLRLAGYFEACSGIILGTWIRCEATEPDRSLTLEQVFRDQLEPSGKPILMGFPWGHGNSSLTLPLGVRVGLDTRKKAVTFLEDPSQI
jgi:muramoyltetrapeptide carboxypeptidase